MRDGDIVRMNGKYWIDPNEREKFYVVAGEPYNSCGGVFVRLEDFPAGYAVDGLEVIDI